jgi:arginyl-tRNA synthetase
MKKKIKAIILKALGRDVAVEVSIPAHAAFGHYSTNVALRLAREEKKISFEAARDLAEKINFEAPRGMFSKIGS